MKNFKRFTALMLIFTIMFGSVITADAAPKTMPDGQIFDAEFYAKSYPDVVAALGTDEAVLYNHYVSYGKTEGRKPYADAEVKGTGAGNDIRFYTTDEKLADGSTLQHAMQWEILTPGTVVTDADILEVAREWLPTGTPWGMDIFYDLQGYKKGNNVPKRGQACQGFAYWLTDALFGTTPAYLINSADENGNITVKKYDIVIYGDHSVVVLDVIGNGADTQLKVAEGNFNGAVNWDRTVSFTNEIIPAGNFGIIRREGM